MHLNHCPQAHISDFFFLINMQAWTVIEPPPILPKPCSPTAFKGFTGFERNLVLYV